MGSTDQEFQVFVDNLDDDGKKDFLRFLEEQANSGVGAEESLAQYAGSKGYNVTAEDIDNISEKVLLSPEEMEAATGGTCFTAGTPEQQKEWLCPSHHGNAYKTGKEEERSHWIFWSRHMKEYYCPDCDHYFWKHED